MERFKSQKSATVISRRPQGASAGFALITFCALIATLMTVVLSVGALALALRRVSLAQSICVQGGVQIQTQMGNLLSELERLNPAATRLRASRAKVNARLKAALATGNPTVIALASAAVLAVKAQQYLLALKQRRLLLQAETTRRAAEHAARVRMLQAGVMRVTTTWGYARNTPALAVRPVPPFDASPDYVLQTPFGRNQRETLDYEITLIPEKFAHVLEIFAPTTARFRCGVTLRAQGGKWEPDLVAASAPLN